MLLFAARTLHFAATIALAGIFAWDCLILGPVIAGWAETGITPRLDRRLSWLAWISLGLALASGAAWLGAIAAEMSGQPLATVLSQQLWAVVLMHTRFGTDWLVRLGLLALLAVALLLRRRRQSAAPSGSEWAGLAAGLMLLAGLAWAGHGGATPGAPGDLHLSADILHLLAAGLWLGALGPLALYFAEARRGGGPHRAPIIAAVMRRFSWIAMAAVAILLATGAVNTWFLAGSAPALLGTDYGQLLLLKIALFLAMLIIAAVNLKRLTPALDNPDGARASRAMLWLRRNALAEAAIGVAILGSVGVLGTLPPGLHIEPGWPLPFRLDVAELGTLPLILLGILAAAACFFSAGMVLGAAAGHYRRAAMLAAGLVLSLGGAAAVLYPAAEEAYPTSFDAPGEPYTASSVVRGKAVYDDNCAVCHGAGGHGDGPAAAGLSIRPADLTEPHLFAHTPGDLFWWVSRGRDQGAMPGFAAVLTPRQRWDVINFVRARAAAVLARGIGPGVSEAEPLEFPDFTFTAAGGQNTLSQISRSGPVLLVLFAPPAPTPRFAALTAAQPQLDQARLQLLAAAVAATARDGEGGKPPAAGPVVQVAPDLLAALALFRAPEDGNETELLLDRNDNIRARWSAGGAAALPDAATLAAAAEEATHTAINPSSHAGHAH